MRRLSVALVTLTLLLGLTAPAQAENSMFLFSTIPDMTYTDWVYADDYSTVTVAGKTYNTDSVLSRNVDGTYSFWHWWGEYLLNFRSQNTYTPDEWYEQETRIRVLDTIERIGKAFPTQEIIMIGGRPWQETEWADEYLACIPAEYHDLAKDVTLNGWLNEVITLGVPVERVRELSRNDIPVSIIKYRTYKTIDDFAADGGDFTNGSPAKEQLKLPFGQLFGLGNASETGTTPDQADPSAPVEPVPMLTSKRVRIVMYLDNPSIEVTDFLGTPRELTGVRKLDQAPIAPSGYTLIPARAVFETRGAYVLWKPEANCVEIQGDDREVVLTIGSNVATVNVYGPNGTSSEATMPQAAQIVNGRTLIPLRFVSETLGYTVEWNGELRRVTIEADVKL